LIFKLFYLFLKCGIEPKTTPPIATQLVVGTSTLPTTRMININDWEETNTLSLTIINNCLDNNVMLHVQSCNISNLAWKELERLSQSQDIITKMYFKDNFHSKKEKMIVLQNTYICYEQICTN